MNGEIEIAQVNCGNLNRFVSGSISEGLVTLSDCTERGNMPGTRDTVSYTPALARQVASALARLADLADRA